MIKIYAQIYKLYWDLLTRNLKNLPSKDDFNKYLDLYSELPNNCKRLFDHVLEGNTLEKSLQSLGKHNLFAKEIFKVLAFLNVEVDSSWNYVEEYLSQYLPYMFFEKTSTKGCRFHYEHQMINDLLFSTLYVSKELQQKVSHIIDTSDFCFSGGILNRFKLPTTPLTSLGNEVAKELLSQLKEIAKKIIWRWYSRLCEKITMR